MDIPKAFNVSGDYKDRTSAPNWEQRLFAEVVLIDKTQNALNPMIYQLKNTALPSFENILNWKADSISLHGDFFTLLGEAVTIDRKKKQILLSNNNVVAYQYLIIASGTKPVFTFEDEKFMAAFQALIEALRVKQKIPSSFAPLITSSKQANSKCPFFAMLQLNLLPPTRAIGKIAHPYICQAFPHKAFGPDLHSINKRLYEVHL